MLGQQSLFVPDASLPLRQRVTVEIITVAQARYALEQFHYLHRCRTGRQINYAVLIDGVVDGVVTYAYPMMSASIEDVPSDELVEFARLFLASNIPHTATCAIGKTIKRVAADWKRLYPDAKPLRLVVSWSDTEYHKGTIYKAANFRWLKRTKGQPPGNSPNSKRGPRTQHGDYNHDKDCWVFRLNTPPSNKGIKLTAAPEPSAAANVSVAQPQLISRPLGRTMGTTTTTTLPTCPCCAGALTETWRSANGYAVRAECGLCGGAWQFYRRPPAFPFWIVAYVLKHPQVIAESRGYVVRNGEQPSVLTTGSTVTAAPVELAAPHSPPPLLREGGHFPGLG